MKRQLEGICNIRLCTKTKSELLLTTGIIYFCRENSQPMSTDSHSHHHDAHPEAEENEIAGPVVVALICLALVVTVIYLLSI